MIKLEMKLLIKLQETKNFSKNKLEINEEEILRENYISPEILTKNYC